MATGFIRWRGATNGEVPVVIGGAGNAGSKMAAIRSRSSTRRSPLSGQVAAQPVEDHRRAGRSHAVVEHLRQLTPARAVGGGLVGSTSTSGPGSRSGRCPPPGGRRPGRGRQGPRRRAGGRADRAAARAPTATGWRLAGRHAHPPAAGEDRETDAIVTVRADQRLTATRSSRPPPGWTGAAAQARDRCTSGGGVRSAAARNNRLACWPSHRRDQDRLGTAAALAIDLLCLDAAAAIGRPARQGRTGDPALPAAARCGPPGRDDPAT